MIQRVQSLFILLTLILTIVALFIPFAVIAADGTEILTVKATGLYQQMQGNEVLLSNIYPILLLISAAILLQIVTLFLFRKRKLQIRFCTFGSVLQAGIILLALFYIYQLKGDNNTIHFGFALILPLISIVSNILAGRYINKDEKLIKSLDRLR